MTTAMNVCRSHFRGLWRFAALNSVARTKDPEPSAHRPDVSPTALPSLLPGCLIGEQAHRASECSVEFLAKDRTKLFESEEFEIFGATKPAIEGMQLTIPAGVTGELAAARGICRPWGMTEG